MGISQVMNPLTPGLQRSVFGSRQARGWRNGCRVLADDLQLGRRVALKLLPPETEADPLARRRFTCACPFMLDIDHIRYHG